jgi:hypothetical protein
MPDSLNLNGLSFASTHQQYTERNVIMRKPQQPTQRDSVCQTSCFMGDRSGATTYTELKRHARKWLWWRLSSQIVYFPGT